MNFFSRALCAVMLVFACTGLGSAQEVKPQKSTTGAVLRSVVVPGWGQWYTGERFKAGVFFVTESAFIFGISRNHDLMMGFKTSTLAEDDRYEKFHRNARNKLIWWLTGITLLSMGDAYVNAHLYGLDFEPELASGETPGGGVRLAYRF